MSQEEFKQLRKKIREKFPRIPRKAAKRMAFAERERKDKKVFGTIQSKDEVREELDRLQKRSYEIYDAKRAEEDRLTQEAIQAYRERFEALIKEWKEQDVEVSER